MLRVGQTVPVVIAALLAAFLLLKVVPGDPARAIAGPRATEEAVAAIREDLGLDDALPTQFARYIGRVVHGDLGTTTTGNVEVTTLIRENGVVTLWLVSAGIVMSLLMMATVAWFAYRKGWGGDVKFDARRMARALLELAIVIGFPLALWQLAQLDLNLQLTFAVALALLFLADWYFRFDAVLPMLTPVLLIGGMTTGVFTATEGAIAACVWALALGVFWYRTLSMRQIIRITMETIETSSTVLLIVAAASIFGWMLTATKTTEAIATWVLAFTNDPMTFLLLANLLMLFVGCFLEPTAAITILVPILLPIVKTLGIDPVHFGLVMVLNLMIGLLHPPMGLVLFVLARVAKLSIERTTMAILPWLVPLLISLALVTYYPQISLWLPRQFL